MHSLTQSLIDSACKASYRIELNPSSLSPETIYIYVQINNVLPIRE